MKKLTIEQANELKNKGITHLASILKQFRYSKYYHVVKIDDVLENGGKWIPADRNVVKNKLGILENRIDWNCTALTAQVLRGSK